MLDIKFVLENVELFRDAIKKKGFIDFLDLDELLRTHAHLEHLNGLILPLRTERNRHNTAMKELAFTGEDVDDKLKEYGRELGRRLQDMEKEALDVRLRFLDLMMRLPNLMLPAVPDGVNDRDNLELWRWGEPRQFDFDALDHLALAEKLGLADFEGGRRVGGARAYALTGNGVLLEEAIHRLAFDTLVKKGYKPIAPPLMVRKEAMEGAGYFPYGTDNAYELAKDELFLTGTAEVGLVALQADRTFARAELPLRFVGKTTCFRREAGAAGRDTRGLFRVHQFQKVEQVAIVEADLEKALAMHKELLENATGILEALELPYRVVAVCAGDLGQGQMLKYDIETHMPVRGGYFETHSCSLLGDFQARRLNIRYRLDAERGEEGQFKAKKEFVFTLNNTAVATPRLLVAFLENHQDKNGAIRIPAKLRPYLGLEMIAA
ncbi:MAG: serine--tRNA ligase [Candidatus Obscuribacterales bacterium]|nr:serine--tRNA ligase [Candidatus Obscuribacterales bacterium]